MSATSSPPALGTLLGSGLTAEVFDWDKRRVLKLLFSDQPISDAAREFQIARAVHATGVRSPQPFEFLEVHGRGGIIFERIDAPSLFSKTERRPWTAFGAIKQLACEHAKLHSITAPPELPSYKEQVLSWFEEDPAMQHSWAAELQRLPDGTALCHGDFHPENLLLPPEGPVIIDWSTAGAGDPCADVARTVHLIATAPLPPNALAPTRLLLSLLRRLFIRHYLNCYQECRPFSVPDMEAWLPVHRAAGEIWRKSLIGQKNAGSSQND